MMMMAKTPDRNTDGNISTDLPERRATVKAAKPKAEAKAATLPGMDTAPDLSANMTEIPPMATTTAAQVQSRTRSRRTIHPKTAARKGETANSNMALATEVVCSE